MYIETGKRLSAAQCCTVHSHPVAAKLMWDQDENYVKRAHSLFSRPPLLMRSMIKEMDQCRRAHTCVINGLLLILFLLFYSFFFRKKSTHTQACTHTHTCTSIFSYTCSVMQWKRAKNKSWLTIFIKCWKNLILRIPFTNSFMNYEHNVVIAYLSITFFVL